MLYSTFNGEKSKIHVSDCIVELKNFGGRAELVIKLPLKLAEQILKAAEDPLGGQAHDVPAKLEFGGKQHEIEVVGGRFEKFENSPSHKLLTSSAGVAYFTSFRGRP